jgi:hypothetical protein
MTRTTATTPKCAKPAASAKAHALPPLLKRQCACGATSGLNDQCKECRTNKLGVQRLAADGGGPTAVPPIVHHVLNSSGQPLDAATRAFMEPRFGHDFSRVRVHTDHRAAESARVVHALAYTVRPDVVFAAKRYEPWTVPGRRLLAHELTHVVQQARHPDVSRLDRQASEEEDTGPAESEASLAEIVILGQELVPSVLSQDNPGDAATDANQLSGGNSACPISELFLVMQAGAAKGNCQVPAGQFGPLSKLAHFRLVGLPVGSPAGGLTVSELFTSLEDPFGVFSALKPQGGVTAADGSFDDCFMIALPRPFPPDFRLKVEQNHRLNGAVIGRNHITYTANNILFCHFDRLPGTCDFGKRCKL